jgi:hypothetical protein
LPHSSQLESACQPLDARPRAHAAHPLETGQLDLAALANTLQKCIVLLTPEKKDPDDGF